MERQPALPPKLHAQLQGLGPLLRQVPVCVQEANGMEPSVSLHHFVHPAWFDDLGGWGKEENVELFVKFAEWSFQQFGTRAKLWATFNEPSVRRRVPTWQ